MTKDFKTDARNDHSQYGMSWMLGGVAVGLVAGLIIFKLMGGNSAISATTTNTTPITSNPTSAKTQTHPTESANTPPNTNNAPNTRPGFSYHAVLPVISMDESIAAVPLENPENNQKSTTNETGEKPATKTTENKTPPATDEAAAGNFTFQLGAYRSQAPALQLQEKARQNGMNTRVEQANVNGQVWYRIRIGPTKDPNVANRWRQAISGMGIEPIMVRM